MLQWKENKVNHTMRITDQVSVTIYHVSMFCFKFSCDALGLRTQMLFATTIDGAKEEAEKVILTKLRALDKAVPDAIKALEQHISG